VFPVAGDGGAIAIGLRAPLHTINRRSRITMIVLVNEVFANTGFQYSPAHGRMFHKTVEDSMEVKATAIIFVPAPGRASTRRSSGSAARAAGWSTASARRRTG